ncbi:class I SAM-dependent DNA methyltransferase [Streptosporangium roseum]|uniref:class I SAM-dependent DNA methyltransferase n=1 Tax=Streptosporangium roseum TaxID=2001 RepID=UPI00332312FA
MKNWSPNTYGDAWADVYDETFSWLDDTDETVEAVLEHAQHGPVLELGVGTGRISLPLARAGIETYGIDASAKMLAKLKSKSGGMEISVHLGDFSDFNLDRSFSVIFLTRNTLSEIPTQEAQVSCMRAIARHLMPGGSAIIDLAVPRPERADGIPRVTRVNEGTVTLLARSVDVVTQHSTAHRIRFGAEGTHVGVIRDRYIWPSELDLMAQLAGMTLCSRNADWRGSPFNADSVAHVSRYTLASASG